MHKNIKERYVRMSSLFVESRKLKEEESFYKICNDMPVIFLTLLLNDLFFTIIGALIIKLILSPFSEYMIKAPKELILNHAFISSSIISLFGYKFIHDMNLSEKMNLNQTKEFLARFFLFSQNINKYLSFVVFCYIMFGV